MIGKCIFSILCLFSLVLMYILALSGLIRVDFQYSTNSVYEVVENGHSKIIVAY